MNLEHQLSRRERQIMDVLYSREQATVNEVRDGIPDPPTSTAVRTMLGILRSKGFIDRTRRGREYVYHARRERDAAGQSAMQRVVDVFFDGSLGNAVAAYLSDPSETPGDEELGRLAKLVREAREREKGRKPGRKSRR